MKFHVSRPHLCAVFYISRDFDCFDSILEWDGISGMEVVFDFFYFLGRFDCLISIWGQRGNP